MDKLKGRGRWSDEKLISRALSAKTKKAYWNNVSELRGRASEGLYARCMELTKSELPAERIAGVDILAEFYRRNKKKRYGAVYPYRKEVIKSFMKMIGVEKNEDMIISLLCGIGHNNAIIKSGEIDPILSFVSSEDINIRSAARMALSGIDDMKAIRGLIILSRDRYSYIRDWATFAIGNLSDLDNDEIREALYARCSDKHHDTRMEAIYGLAKRKDDRVRKFLEKEFDDCTVYVLESIRDLDAKEYLPRLEAMFEETKNDPETNQYWLNHLKECIEKLRGDSQEAVWRKSEASPATRFSPGYLN